jgi:CRP-like cAMP-binding protein/anti-anti-sigma regulatory factor
MSRSPIRRIRTGQAVRSKVRRDVDRTEILAEHGHRIAVVELEGTVFFASADSVARKLEELAAGGVDYLVLDMKRVRRVDATGFRVLGQTYGRLAGAGVTFGFSYVNPHGDRPDLGRSLTLTGGVASENCFATTDAALEAFEESLLARLETEGPDAVEWSLDRFARSLELNREEQRIVSAMLQNRSYAPGEAVCRIGAPGDSMFLVSRGSADVSIPIPESGRHRRLSTVTAGTIIGEMSLLDGQPRSADILAKDHVFCYELTAESFSELQSGHPEIARKIYTALVRILGSRLREANALISELDV